MIVWILTKPKWIHFSPNFASIRFTCCKMKARNRVISAAHLITCSIKKHVKAPDLTCMPLYGNVLSKVAWTVTQHWVLKKTSRAFTAYYDIPAFVLKKRKTKNQSWPNNVQRGWRGSRNNKQQMQAIVSQCQFKYPIRRSCFSLLFEFDWDLLHTSCLVALWLEGSLSLPGNSLRWWLC